MYREIKLVISYPLNTDIERKETSYIVAFVVYLQNNWN